MTSCVAAQCRGFRHTDGSEEPKTNTTHASLLGRSTGGEEPGPFAPCHRQRAGHLAHHSDEVRQGHQPACVWWGLCSKRQRPETNKIACQFTLTFSLDNNKSCAIDQEVTGVGFFLVPGFYRLLQYARFRSLS